DRRRSRRASRPHESSSAAACERGLRRDPDEKRGRRRTLREECAGPVAVNEGALRRQASETQESAVWTGGRRGSARTETQDDMPLRPVLTAGKADPEGHIGKKGYGTQKAVEPPTGARERLLGPEECQRETGVREDHEPYVEQPDMTERSQHFPKASYDRTECEPEEDEGLSGGDEEGGRPVEVVEAGDARGRDSYGEETGRPRDRKGGGRLSREEKDEREARARSTRCLQSATVAGSEQGHPTAAGFIIKPCSKDTMVFKHAVTRLYMPEHRGEADLRERKRSTVGSRDPEEGEEVVEYVGWREQATIQAYEATRREGRRQVKTSNDRVGVRKRIRRDAKSASPGNSRSTSGRDSWAKVSGSSRLCWSRTSEIEATKAGGVCNAVRWPRSASGKMAGGSAPRTESGGAGGRADELELEWRREERRWAGGEVPPEEGGTEELAGGEDMEGTYTRQEMVWRDERAKQGRRPGASRGRSGGVTGARLLPKSGERDTGSEHWMELVSLKKMPHRRARKKARISERRHLGTGGQGAAAHPHVTLVGGIEVPSIRAMVHYQPGDADFHYYKSGRRFRPGAEGVPEEETLTPEGHIDLAKKVVAPEDMDAPLPTTLTAAIEALARQRDTAPRRRRAIMDRVLEAAKRLEPLRAEWGAQMPECCREVNLPLLEYLCEETQYPDKEFVKELRENGGLALYGELPGSAVFAPLWTSDTIKRDRLCSTDDIRTFAHKRFDRLQGDVKEPTEEERWLYQQAEEEVRQGRLAGPYSIEELRRKERVGATLRHVVEQPGKLRPCDDYRTSLVNRGTHVPYKVTLPELDTSIDVVKTIWRQHGEGDDPELALWKRDHRDAYRQIPVRATDQSVGTVLIRNADGEWVGYMHRVMPFGAVASVSGYLRLGMMLSHVMRVLFACPIQSYLDDYYAIEYVETAESSFEVFGELNNVLGWVVKKTKDVRPQSAAKVLGVMITLKAGEVRCSLDDDRKDSLMSAVAAAVREGLSRGAKGRKLAGRLSFACSVLRGRCGRGLVRVLIREAVQERADRSEEVRQALMGMFHLLGEADGSNLVRTVSRRQVTVGRSGRSGRKHVSVYADATGEGGVGGVAVAADGEVVWWYGTTVPRWYDGMLVARETQVIAYELYAVAQALSSFCRMKERCYIVYTDATVVENLLRRGSSRSGDLNMLVARVWEYIARQGIAVYFCRVQTSANPADGPSRGAPVRAAGWKTVTPKQPTFLHP
ncbi:hypothetical protein FOL47_000737, partial [Perkinsus chesapeaki]